MLAGACVGLIVGPFFYGIEGYPWISLLFGLPAIILLHPLMDKDVATFVGADLLRSPRTYIAIALIVAAGLLAYPYQKAMTDCWIGGACPDCSK
jgi:hypothetical protein